MAPTGPRKGRSHASELSRRLVQSGQVLRGAEVTAPSKRYSGKPPASTSRSARSGTVTPMERRRSRHRLLGLNVCGLLLVVAMMGRAAQLQVMQRETLAERGDRQRLREIPIRAERGDILDRFGAPLAMSVRDWRLIADPQLIANPAATADLVLARLPANTVDRAWLINKLSEQSRYAVLVNGIDDDLKSAIEAAKVKGVYFAERFRRENPSADLARSIVGRVDTEQRGTSGLEKMLETELTGRDGLLVSERSETGSQIPAGKRTLRPAVSGKTFVTTIDRSLQYAVDGMNSKAIADAGARGGIVIVCDVKTGEILALSNMELTDDGGIRSTGRNTALVSVYEPGSVNKVITMAAAIEERVVTPKTPLTVPDHFQVGDHRFKDDVAHKTMRWTIRDVLVNSSNVGTIRVAQMLNKNRLDRYLRGFGLGAKTAIDFPGESGGIMLPLNKWTSTSIGTVPIGQGISVTAVQMLSVYNTLANGGVRMPMRLLRSTVDDRGVETPVGLREQPVTVVSQSTAAEMTSMLVDVVDEGTGRAARVKGYSVAGKTGTAQKPNERSRGYRAGAYVASFAGYFPAEAPRLSVIVVLDEPQTSIYGGVVAAPLFAEVARWAGQHYRLPPSAGSRVVLTPDPSTVVSAEMRAVARTGNWQAATIRRNALPDASSLTPRATIAAPPASRSASPTVLPETDPRRTSRAATPTTEPPSPLAAPASTNVATTEATAAPATVVSPPAVVPRTTTPDLARREPPPPRATVAASAPSSTPSTAPAVNVVAAGSDAPAPAPVVAAGGAVVSNVEAATS